MYKIKQIKRYKLNTFKKEELKQILNKLHFRNGSFQSKYKNSKVMSICFALKDDIELYITIDIDNCKYDDYDDNLVLDDNFCQPYFPFYSEENYNYLQQVINSYNKTMDNLVKKGLLIYNLEEEFL